MAKSSKKLPGINYDDSVFLSFHKKTVCSQFETFSHTLAYSYFLNIPQNHCILNTFLMNLPANSYSQMVQYIITRFQLLKSPHTVLKKFVEKGSLYFFHTNSYNSDLGSNTVSLKRASKHLLRSPSSFQVFAKEPTHILKHQ